MLLSHAKFQFKNQSFAFESGSGPFKLKGVDYKNIFSEKYRYYSRAPSLLCKHIKKRFLVCHVIGSDLELGPDPDLKV